MRGFKITVFGIITVFIPSFLNFAFPKSTNFGELVVCLLVFMGIASLII